MQKSLLWALLDLVFLVIFNIVFFVVGGIFHPVSVWIAYVFINLAYVALLVTPIFVRRSSSASVFGFSLYTVSALYFIVELVVGLIIIFVKPETAVASFVVQLILFGVYAILFLSNVLANEHTADNAERHESEVKSIKSIAAQVKNLIGKVDDPDTNKEIERVYDLLHTSPSKAVPESYKTETEIGSLVQSLEMAVWKKDIKEIKSICQILSSIIDKRIQVIAANQ